MSSSCVTVSGDYIQLDVLDLTYCFMTSYHSYYLQEFERQVTACWMVQLLVVCQQAQTQPPCLVRQTYTSPFQDKIILFYWLASLKTALLTYFKYFGCVHKIILY